MDKPISKYLTLGLLAIGLLADAASATAGEPAAWRIAGVNGGEVTLLGSMHMLRARDYPLPARVNELFERADLLVMELDLDDVDPNEEQTTIMRTATLSPGKVLRDVIDDSVYSLTDRRLRELGVDIMRLEHFEPWFVAVTVLDIGMNRIGFEGQRGLEQYLVDKSRQAGKAILGLETFAYRIGIFDALSPKAQQAMLEQTLRELDEAQFSMDRMAAAWRNGELASLTDDLLEDFEDFPGLYETLVSNRNAEWLSPIERFLTDGKRYLVVVGALHLVGPNSVIEMLEARGHDVTQLR